MKQPLMTTLVMLSLIACHPAMGDDSLDEVLERFAAETGISHWPRLDLCTYEGVEKGAIVGLFLRVQQSGKQARSRWDGRCHVPFLQQVIDWPEHAPLFRGDNAYVVAARLEESDDYVPAARILAVMPGTHDPRHLEDATGRLACRPDPRGKETDRFCKNW
jgi:hypothetical protein